MATEHTPLPWKTFYASNGALLGVGDATGGGIVDASGGLWRSGKERKANAEFITRACNSHYQLVEALADARQSLAVAIHGLPEMLERNALTDEEDMVGSLQAAIERIDAALKLAGGQQ